MFSHGFMSFAAIGISVACLLIMGTFTLVAYNANENLSDLQQENAVVAFVDDSLTETQARDLQAQLEKVDNVADCTFMSRDEAKENYIEKYDGDELYGDLPADVFRHRYVIHVTDPDRIMETKTAVEQVTGIAKARADQAVAEGFTTARNVASIISIALIAILLLVSVFKLPALLGMGLTVVVSIVFAMVFQGVNFVELMNYAANGFTLSTGVDIVDPMLNRGGITSMTGLLITFMVASVMGGIITATGILDVLAKDVLLKFIKSRGVLVTVTLIYCYIVNFLTAGGQTVAIIVTEQTFEDAFDRMGIHRRVLSRTLEDAGTLSAPIVPWGVATLYVMEVLGCGTEYIPYCWFIFIVPIFSICAFSGFGIWDKDGNKMWGRKKAAAK